MFYTRLINSFQQNRYHALELHEATLNQLFLEEGDPKPSEKAVLFQLANGLDYIHSKSIVHRNIKPESVVIVRSAIDGPVYVKWSGFGLSSQRPGHVYDPYELIPGTLNWMSPEILKYILENVTDGFPKMLAIHGDLFSAGCLFFFFLSGGSHPFGQGTEIVPNIIAGKRTNINSN